MRVRACVRNYIDRNGWCERERCSRIDRIDWETLILLNDFGPAITFFDTLTSRNSRFIYFSTFTLNAFLLCIFFPRTRTLLSLFCLANTFFTCTAFWMTSRREDRWNSAKHSTRNSRRHEFFDIFRFFTVLKRAIFSYATTRNGFLPINDLISREAAVFNFRSAETWSHRSNFLISEADSEIPIGNRESVGNFNSTLALGTRLSIFIFSP